MPQPLIQLRNLSKSYREGDSERVVLQHVQADIARGEFIALLGRSGSGKSTLLNLISAIDLPSSGEVHIGNRCLTTLSEHQRTLFRRRHIGFVFQFFNLIPTLTAWENLLLPLELNGPVGPAEEAKARALLAKIGLEDRAQSYPDRLSGGEQQRVAMARALIHRPLVLLADEPTGNLDAETGRQVMDLLQALVRSWGMTTVMVTHSQELARRADRILTLSNGQLVEKARGSGDPEASPREPE